MLERKLFLALTLYLALTLFFGIIQAAYPSIRSQRTWRKGSRLDSFYWFFTLIFSQVLSTICIAAIVVPIFWVLGRTIDMDVLTEGYGYLGSLPHWLQGLAIVFIGDFMGYWTHRWLHTGRMWKIHAIHHSSEELDWLSSVRVHPLNDIISRTAQSFPVLLLGFAPLSVEIYAPFLTAYLAFIHANLPWSYGPFRYLIASPVFHRWHHSREIEALDKNFAGLFPIFDVLFGTFYMPEKCQPKNFGLYEEYLPMNFRRHLLYPFRESNPGLREIES